jgi:hypothetical protein
METLPTRNDSPPESDAPDCKVCGVQTTKDDYSYYCDNVRCQACDSETTVIIDQLRDLCDTLETQRDAARRDVTEARNTALHVTHVAASQIETLEATVTRLTEVNKETRRLYLAEKRDHAVTLRLLAAKTTQPENAVTVAEWEEQYNVQQKRACDAEAEVKRLRDGMKTAVTYIENAMNSNGLTAYRFEQDAVMTLTAALDGAK